MNRRRFLTAKEVQAMMQAARRALPANGTTASFCWPFAMACALANCWNLHYHNLNLHEGRVNVRRLKNGFSTIHPLRFDEREAIERWSLVRAGWKAADKTDALFISRRGTALSRQQAYRIIRSAGENAGTVTHTHPHMLRHACGYELAERGTDTRLIQDYLGHRNIRHTVRYTASNAARFAGIWERNNLLEEKDQKTKNEITD